MFEFCLGGLRLFCWVVASDLSVELGSVYNNLKFDCWVLDGPAHLAAMTYVSDVVQLSFYYYLLLYSIESLNNILLETVSVFFQMTEAHLMSLQLTQLKITSNWFLPRKKTENICVTFSSELAFHCWQRFFEVERNSVGWTVPSVARLCPKWTWWWWPSAQVSMPLRPCPSNISGDLWSSWMLRWWIYPLVV